MSIHMVCVLTIIVVIVVIRDVESELDTPESGFWLGQSRSPGFCGLELEADLLCYTGCLI